MSVHNQSIQGQGEDTRNVKIKHTEQAQPRVASRELLGAKGVLAIDHESDVYLLRMTKSGKLILTK